MPRLLHILGIWLMLSAVADATDLVPFTILNGGRIEASLTGRPGDQERGRKLYFDRELTGCSVCHGSPGGPDGEEPKDDAPDLTGVGARLGDGEIRLWIAAPQAIDPETRMPGFYLPGQRPEADAPVINGPRLTAQQVEDLIAWLASLKDAE